MSKPRYLTALALATACCLALSSCAMFEHKCPTYYAWITQRPNMPKTHIWLQASDDKKNSKVVYVRIETE